MTDLDRDEPAATTALAPLPDRTPPWLGRLAFWSSASALAALVPVPFLDDHLVRVTRRAMVRELARERGFTWTDDDVRVLGGAPRQRFGCTFGLLLALAVRGALLVVRRVFRSLFFWLALRDASNAASFTFHEGFLLRAALADAPTSDARARPDARRLRSAIEQVIADVDPRPVRQTFRAVLRSSFGVVGAAAAQLRRLLLGVREEEAEAQVLKEVVPPTLVEGLARALAAQNPYLDDLRRRIAAALVVVPDIATTPPPIPPQAVRRADPGGARDL